MSNYVLRPRAQADLNDIWDYTALNWSLDQADRYVEELISDIESLTSGLKTAQSADRIRSGYLKFLSGSHVLYCRRSNPNVLEVVRILHQRMDVETALD